METTPIMGADVPARARSDGETAISPDFVRISAAAAIELGLAKGRFLRGCGCGCINLLQNYTTSCAANCSYCGLARERPGAAGEKSFIRVDWPVFPTDQVAECIARREAVRGVGRVCISQVQDRRAYADLLEITRRIHRAAPAVPISALVSATTLDEDRLATIAAAGVDIIGVGLDAATEPLFHRTRGRGAKGPHDWHHHWRIIRAARRLYGPMKVNCHVIVGLGETDRDLIGLIYQLHSEQIACYLFSFNPEPGTAMQGVTRAPLERLRRVQLVKYLIEHDNLPPSALRFDSQGALEWLDASPDMVSQAIEKGEAFMTNGCPDRGGKMTCNRPYGSYRPGEPFRDYPFPPTLDDLETICSQMRLHDIMPGNARYQRLG